MEPNAQTALKTLSLKKTLIPILCGVIITGFIFYKSGKIKNEILSLIANPNWKYLSMAMFSIILREVGHIYRLHLLSKNTLSWKSCFYIAMLWEFSSAVTPSVIGGGLVAIFIFSREGLTLGRSLSYVIITGILDNIFFLGAASRSFFGDFESIFAMLGDLSSSIKAIFFTNYTVLFIYTAIIATGVFINPKLLKCILMHTTSIGFLKRWRKKAYQMSKDIIITANEFRGRKPIFWFKIFACTVCTWMVRYGFLNLLIASYIQIPFSEHLTIFRKQIIIWTLMLIPLAPGGSGIAEISFQELFCTTLGDYMLLILLLWRICTFYLYLALGALVIPKWIKRVFKK